MSSKRVLITGAGGRIGSLLRTTLADKYEISGVDRVEAKDTTVADLTNLDAIVPAFDGQDVVVHLAAEPRVYMETAALEDGTLYRPAWRNGALCRTV